MIYDRTHPASDADYIRLVRLLQDAAESRRGWAQDHGHPREQQYWLGQERVAETLTSTRQVLPRSDVRVWSWEASGGVVNAALKLRLDETDAQILDAANTRWGPASIGDRCIIIQLATSLAKAQAAGVAPGQPLDLSQTREAWSHVCDVLDRMNYRVSMVALDIEGNLTQGYWNLKSAGQLAAAGLDKLDEAGRIAYRQRAHEAYAAHLAACYYDVARQWWPGVEASNYNYVDWVGDQLDYNGVVIPSGTLLPGGLSSPDLYYETADANLARVDAVRGECVPWLPPPGWTRSTKTPTDASKAEWAAMVRGLADRGVTRLLMWWPDSLVSEAEAAWGAQQIEEAYQ